MRAPEDERNVCYSSTILHQPIFFFPPLERLVSALLSWAHFLLGKEYNNDQCPALLISFVLSKYFQCLKLGGEVERGEQTQLQRMSPFSGSHQHSHREGKKIQITKPTHSEDPPAHISPTVTHLLFVF